MLVSYTYTTRQTLALYATWRWMVLIMERAIVLAIFCVVKQSVQEAAYPGVPGNLALFKTGRHSSTHDTSTGIWRATDGDIERIEHTYMAITKPPPADQNPWFRINLQDLYLVQTVKIFRRLDCCFSNMETVEVRVGKSITKNFGNTNELCGKPMDMTIIDNHVFRCEIYGQYINVKKTNRPVLYDFGIAEIIVNAEPTINIALGKTTTSQLVKTNTHGSEKAVDGKTWGYNFVSRFGSWPAWLMIDFGETLAIVKIFLVHNYLNYYLDKIVITIGDDASNHGQNNPKFGNIHDFSKAKSTVYYLKPRMSGRYTSLESLRELRMVFKEIEIYSESMPFIAERSNGLGSYSVTVYNDQQTVLPCHADGYPLPHVAWVSDGVVLQNRSSDQDTNLVIVANGTKGTTAKYECWANNVHGKDLYVVTATFAGRYDMCAKPKEIKDPSRNRLSKQDATKEIQSDENVFDATKMYSFFNPLSSINMKLTTSCPPVSSCGTNAPGWLPDGHPQPDDGIVRRKVCFHYNGDCCYKSLYIDVINCPGMFVYGLKNTVFDFSARYCFEDDMINEGYLPFRFVPSFFAPVGGSDTALINHVIAKEHGIEGTTQCLIVCMMNRCRSLNYDKTEKICEVSDVTKDDYPRDLSAKAGFQYYHPMKQPVVVKKYN